MAAEVTDLALHFAALVLGLAGNLLGALKAASKSAGGAVRPFEWLRRRPYRTLCGVVGALGGFVVLTSTGQLTAVSAFACGYMGHDVADRIASAAGKPVPGAEQ